MWLIYVIIGFIISVIIQTIYKLLHHSTGYIDVDSRTEQCRVHLNSADLSNSNIKKVILKVNHNVDISREDHVL